MNGEKFNSDRAPQAVGLYPHARKVGNLLFLSGVGPRKAGQTDIPGVTLNANGEIESYDIAAQCHSVFENIKYILEDAGSSWDNIVDVQVFLFFLQLIFFLLIVLLVQFWIIFSPYDLWKLPLLN